MKRDYLPSPAGQDEQRRADRRATFADVWVDPGGTAPATAHKLLNISASGAKLAVPDGFAPPENFVLHFGSATHFAKVVWRTHAAIGVKFEKPQIKVVSE
ncbi:MAG TPA: PilZ domain-containing protein [Methylocystis sp.]|nr:PilZ domain-containing protein [Methylocystis sp.]